MASGNGLLRSDWIEVGGLPVHMRVSAGARPPGTPPVVLVHGLGLSGRYMMPLAEALAPHVRVLVPDLPGFGDSGKPRGVLGVAGLADALAAWAEAAGLEPAAFVGNSFGCQVIAELAARHPERVARAVLQGPTTDPEARSWAGQFVLWRRNAPFNPPGMDEIAWSDYRKCGYWRLFETTRRFLKDPVEQKLPRVAAPALVVRGSRDPICRPRWAARVAHLIPRSSLVEIPGVAHTLCYTAPEPLGAVTRQYLAE